MCFKNYKSTAMKKRKCPKPMNIVIKLPIIIMINMSINRLIRKLKINHKITLILAVKMKKENKMFKLIIKNLWKIK